MTTDRYGPTLTQDQVLAYEIGASYCVGWISNPTLQALVAKYFAWKVRRKYARYLRFKPTGRVASQVPNVE